jgi:VRR-NUC domain
MSLIDEAAPPRNSRAEFASGSGGLDVPKADSGRSALPTAIRRPPQFRQRRQRPEQQIQRAVFEHLRTRGAPGIFAWHPFSGGLRSKLEAAIYKGLGARAGLPDVMILHRGKLSCIELKTTTGRLSPAQEETLIALRAAGATACHVHSLDQGLRLLEAWGLLRGRKQ